MATATTNSQLPTPDVDAPPAAQNQPQNNAQQSLTATDELQPESQSQSEPQPLSKKAQKKLRKAEFLAERKLERRAREKEKKKEKKRERAERIAAGEDVDTAAEDDGRAKKRAKLSHGAPRNAFGARVVVDLGFDDKMSEKEVSSLCSQLAYTYSANRHADTFFSNILYTSLNGRTLTRLESMNDAGYKRWTGTEWWAESYEDLWRETPVASDEVAVAGEEAVTAVQDGAKTSPVSGKKPGRKGSKQVNSRGTASKDTVVYLTADSSDELNELKEGETYIIGGICDHNRYKNLCLNKATASSIRAARLPIGRYLTDLPTRKVLTVNQVFEILLKWVETKDWEQAFYAVIPKRKFQQGGAGRAKSNDGGEDGEGEGGEYDDKEQDRDETGDVEVKELTSSVVDDGAVLESEVGVDAGAETSVVDDGIREADA